MFPSHVCVCLETNGEVKEKIKAEPFPISWMVERILRAGVRVVRARPCITMPEPCGVGVAIKTTKQTIWAISAGTVLRYEVEGHFRGAATLRPVDRRRLLWPPFSPPICGTLFSPSKPWLVVNPLVTPLQLHTPRVRFLFPHKKKREREKRRH